MKYLSSSKLLAFALLFCMITPVVSGQINPADVLKATKVADNVWAIVENNTVNIYLIAGKDSALLIDTGYGTGDLKAFAQSLTNLPLIVVNTHGHGDHNGGDAQFSKVYAHPADFPTIQSILDRGRKGSGAAETAPASASTPATVLVPVKEGYLFDLGGKRIKVVEVPGHTAGSICLIDIEDRILFGGDHTNAMVWMFLDVCLPLETYMKSLRKIEKMVDEYDMIMPGHNAPLDKYYVTDIATNVKSILDGTGSSAPYNYNGIKGAMLSKYKTSEVAYNPDRLFEKK
jgi:glyoxylase-like metal-dependent hydrolase (beta-lactamase superfamily II)